MNANYHTLLSTIINYHAVGNKQGYFLKKPRCCVGGRVWQGNLLLSNELITLIGHFTLKELQSWIFRALALNSVDHTKLLRSLDIFKFDMIVDVSFCRLNEQMILNDIVFQSAVFTKCAQTEIGKWWIYQYVSLFILIIAQYTSVFSTRTCLTKIWNVTEIADPIVRHICLQLGDLVAWFCQLSSTIMNRLNANMIVHDSEWKLKLSSPDYHQLSWQFERGLIAWEYRGLRYFQLEFT